MISKPQEVYLADTYRFTYKVEGVDLLLDHFNEGKDGLHAEITVTTSRQPAPGLLHFGRLNLSSGPSKGGLVKALRQRAVPGFLDDVDFPGMVEQVCYRALSRWREGEPFIDLRTVNYRERPRWLVDPFVEHSGPTIIFAKGGSGKSLFGLALAVTVATGIPILGSTPTAILRTGYIDWEADEFTHAERLAAICDAAGIDMPELLYRRGVASLAEGAATLRRYIAEKGLGFIVIDSVGAARGGDPNSAELTIKLFAAIRSLGIPCLCIDHITKNPNDPKENPFGSVYTTNLARITWRMDTIQAEGSDQAAISLTNMKINNGRIAKRRGYRAFYKSDEDDRLVSAWWEPADMGSLPEFLESLSQRDQVAAVLKNQNRSMHPKEIAAILQAEFGITMPEDTVRAVLSAGGKDTKRNRAIFAQDATIKGAWGLLSWRTA